MWFFVWFWFALSRGRNISIFLINRQHYQESSQYNIVDFSGRFGHFRIPNAVYHIKKKIKLNWLECVFYDDNSVQFRSDQPNAKVYTYVITKWFSHCVSSHIMKRTICRSHAMWWVCASRELFSHFMVLDFRIRIVMNIVEWEMYVPVALFRNLFQFRFVNRLLCVSTTSIKTTHLMFKVDSNGSFRAHKIFRTLCYMVVAHVKL